MNHNPNNTFLVILFILTLQSCSQDNIIDEKVKNELPSIVVEESINLLVDSLTVNKLIYPQVINSANKGFVTSINVIDNSLKVFDLEKKNNTRTIHFEIGGKDNIGEMLSAMVLSNDSILYLDKSSRLFLMDNNLSILNEFKLKDPNEKGLPLFYDNILRPVKSSNRLTVANFYTTMTDRYLNLEINLENGELKYKNPIPIEAVEGFYGMGDFDSWNYVYNERNGTYLFNFPNLDSLYEYDQDFNLLRKTYGRSGLKVKNTEKLINIDLESVSQDYQIDRNEVVKKIKSSFIYSDLIFNPKKNEYYRLVAHPISDFNIQLNHPIKSEVREYSLIVLDKDLAIKKEYLIPFNKYMIDSDCFFVYDGKLYMQKVNNNEDYIELDIFKL